MKKIVLALALVAASSISAFAQASDFAAVDTDGDGFVNLEEAQAAGYEFTDEQWTEADAKAFEERASCIEKQYEGYSPVEGVQLNGKLTLGENTADNGGLRVALMALENTLKNKRVGKIDGFTPEQRLFLGWSQVWCQNITDEAARLRAQTDPHSPGEFRVNGVLSNMPAFRKAFGCKVGQPMAPENMCRVW